MPVRPYDVIRGTRWGAISFKGLLSKNLGGVMGVEVFGRREKGHGKEGTHVPRV